MVLLIMAVIRYHPHGKIERKDASESNEEPKFYGELKMLKKS